MGVGSAVGTAAALYGSANAPALGATLLGAVPTRAERQTRRDVRQEKKALSKQAGGLDANQRAQMLGAQQAQIAAQSRQARAAAMRASVGGNADYASQDAAISHSANAANAQALSQVNQADLQARQARMAQLEEQKRQIAAMNLQRRQNILAGLSSTKMPQSAADLLKNKGQDDQTRAANQALNTLGAPR